MTIQELIQFINNAYEIINDKIISVKNSFDEKGINWTRISFEDISLEDMLNDVLIPILPELINKYECLPQKVLWKSYKVYIASLCEISKNGLDGGILKTLRGRIGEFSLGRHYSLIKQALAFERIPIIDKAKKYEETIINEAGIPRGFRRKCLQFFTTYWKWLHNYDRDKRYAFLSDFLNEEPINEVFILDNNDFNRLVNLRFEFSSFSEKVIKTCEKLDRVFSAIDQFPEEITEDNLLDVSSTISKELGFDILTVIRTDAIKQYILEYSKRISFSKLEHILELLPKNELIELPNRSRKKKEAYTFTSYMGGKHIIRGNAYEVSFPIHLSLDDLYSIDRNTPLLIGNSVIYTSEEDILVERDGNTRPYRVFYSPIHGYLNVYYERVTPASFIYIDGQLLPNEEPFSKRVFIGKYWDHDAHHYKLAVYIAELKFADRTQQMQQVRFKCNDVLLYGSTVNRNGSFVIRDIVRPLPGEIGDVLNFDFCVGANSISNWTIDVSEIYIWGKQSGLRVYDSIDISQWIGTPEIIIFSKQDITSSSINLEYLYDECGFRVYKGVFDRTADYLQLGEINIPIIEPKTPYLQMNSEFSILSEKMCVENAPTFGIKIINYSDEADCVLRIEHDSRSVSYNVRNIDTTDIKDVLSLFPSSSLSQFDVSGQWLISLISKTKCISSISVFMLPKLSAQVKKDIYASGEPVEIIIKSASNCFEVEGIYTNQKTISVGKASLEYIDGNIVPKILETNVYIDKCEISKQISITPDVWDIIYINDQNKVKRIDSGAIVNYKELIKGFYVFTPKTTQLDILVNNNAYYVRLIPGKNIMNLKKLLNNALLKNHIKFSLNNGTKDFYILFNPSVSYDHHRIDGRNVLFSFDYYGPINVEVMIRIFSGETIICNAREKMDLNSTSFEVLIDKAKFLFNSIIIESKIGKQDFLRLFEGEIKLLKQKHEKGLFNSSSSIIELLEWASGENDVVDHSSIIRMLEAGGEI